VWVKADRLHPLISRETLRFKSLYRNRGAVEREFGRLKNEWALALLRVRRIERVRLHADLTILASCPALSPEREPCPSRRRPRTLQAMCAGCAMAAAAGATGVRSWLQTRHLTWLTPRRMRVATIALMTAAFAVSSFGLSGSSKQATHPPVHAVGFR
jgi:hypothetical protein